MTAELVSSFHARTHHLELPGVKGTVNQFWSTGQGHCHPLQDGLQLGVTPKCTTPPVARDNGTKESTPELRPL